MKTLHTIMLGLMAGALGLAGCASDADVAAPGAAGDITLSVTTEDAAASRALAVVDGYEFKFVMQLLDRSGATVGTQSVVDGSTGTADFTIKAADIDAGASRALFWAEYVPTAGAQKVYDSGDLRSVRYAASSYDLSDASLVAAADAFAGSLTTLSQGASVSLARPLAKVSFAPTNPDKVSGATVLTVKYAATSGYDVLTGNVAADSRQELTLTNAAFNPAANPWYTVLMIAPANLATFDGPVTMELTGGVAKSYTIPAGKIPMDANFMYNLTATLGDGADLDPDINGEGGGDTPTPGPDEPGKPGAIALGSYVDATGAPVADKSQAVGIVVALDGIGSDKPANYPAALQGKTIVAYAIALENTSPVSLLLGTQKFVTNDGQYSNGTQCTDLFIKTCADSPWAKSYTEWVAAHPLSGDKVSAWYIPTKDQINAWLTQLYDDTTKAAQTVPASGTPEFKALFPQIEVFGVEDGKYTAADYSPAIMVASSTVNKNGYPSGGRFLTSLTGICTTYQMKQVNNVGDAENAPVPALCRPMFTIFK